MTKRRRRIIWCVVAALLVVIGVFLAYGVAETYRLEVKQYTFVSEDLPAEFDGTRVVLLTDIHRGLFFSQSRVRSLVDQVNALEPDFVVLGGDYVYRSTDYAASCLVELQELRAPLGRFAVLGNHDYGSYEDGGEGPLPVIRAINNAGITLLRDRGLWIEKEGKRIRIGGVSDYGVDRPQITSILAGTEESDFVLLVSHHPDYAEELPAGAVDLMLSGHTHGGQITFFGLRAFYVPSQYGERFRTGMVATGKTTAIVSSGIGTSTIPPIRVFARPQIVVITLQSGVTAKPHP